jgi:glutathione S-transferase
MTLCMKLFYSPNACSLSPHIALREAGLNFDLELVDLSVKKLKDGSDYRSINPKGYVPALQLDDGTVLTEGAVIVQYIADKKPQANLAPPNGTMDRYRLQEWLHFIGTEIHKGVGNLYAQLASDDLKQATRDRVKGRLDFMARSLEGKKFLMGDQFTVADGYAFYVLRSWQRLTKTDLSWSRVLLDYFKRLSERPSIVAALKAEGIS